ncbi:MULTISPECIES: hypothetical protein [Halococcus]|uniref:Uncharacterized protein n=1 Tax=Halococcus saccharolyticus DSM 5350 TaxID=1227455 RepID=M0MFT0_9EURY|nr:MULTISPECIES: hypothetical protein [Halococcus]EMA43529.1 hypothetical protein C449_13247 [Halococcus saccharolyticus DSM 5350]
MVRNQQATDDGEKTESRLTETLKNSVVPFVPQAALIMMIGAVTLVSPAAAQQGICDMPGGSALLGMGGLLIQGVLVIGGVYLIAQGAASMFGAGRGAGGRQNALYGIIIVIFGLVLPQFVGFLAEQTGTSLADAGVGCLFG